MSVRALIVDDERLARVALRGLLDDRNDVEVVGEADSVASARKQIGVLKPDVVFLDIEMPDGLGFDVFDAVGEGTRVVFVTAYDAHALRAFEVNALDYLVKPVDPAGIDRALKRAGAEDGDGAPGADGTLRMDDTICLQEASRMQFARVDAIRFVQAADDYTEVHLDGDRTALVGQRLRRWAQRLPEEHFVQIHRSTIVNLTHVAQISVEDGRWHVQLRGSDVTLPLSRRYAQALKQRLEWVV